MARSIKKGPYVDVKLEKKVLAVNDVAQKEVLSKHGAAVQRSLRISWVTHSQCTTVTNSYLYT